VNSYDFAGRTPLVTAGRSGIGASADVDAAVARGERDAGGTGAGSVEETAESPDELAGFELALPVEPLEVWGAGVTCMAEVLEAPGGPALVTSSAGGRCGRRGVRQHAARRWSSPPRSSPSTTTSRSAVAGMAVPEGQSL